jgi:hypothetical protein|tara:strand:- start:20497 stop:21537 length:1041 start_codon:yes stop_codon:yes gene_type:complete
MTDQIQDQDVELDENEIEEAHDPKNAEAQSIASVQSAEDKGPKAKARKGDKSNSEKMPKTKAGMINAAYTKMAGMKKEDLAGALTQLMGEDIDLDTEALVAEASNVDFSEDLNALVESEATLSEEFKAKTAVIFEAAIKSKLAEEVTRLEASYEEELTEAVSSTKAELVEKVDSYLNYVVENWMKENQLAVQNGLRTEIAEKFMNSLKDLFTESYIEVPESKVDLVDELAQEVEELEEALNKSTEKAIEVSEELEVMKRATVISEASADLATTQAEKLASLVEDIDFVDVATFTAKVQTIKESYFTKTIVESSIDEEIDDADGDFVEAPSDVMSQYISAIRQSSKT